MNRIQKTQFALLLILAATVRLPGVFTEPFWSDEYFSWLTVTQPSLIQFVLRCAGVDVYPPLGYLPSWLIAKFTDEIWALRLPPALAGAACAGVVVHMMKRYLPWSSALWLGLLAAFNPLSAYLGWEAKAYNLFALVNLLLLNEALLLLEDPSRGVKRAALWCAASMYSFFLSPYLLAALFAGAWLKEGGFSPGLRRLSRGLAWGLVWSLPLLPFFIKTVLVYSGSSAFNSAPRMAIPWSLENFSAGFWLPGKIQLLALILFSALALFAVLRRRGPWRMLLVLALLTPALFLAVSLATGKPSYNDRAMLLSSFAWTALAGLGAASLGPRLRGFAFGALAATQLFALRAYEPRPDYEEAYRLVQEEWQEGDAVFHGLFDSGLPFQYYARKNPLPNWIPERDSGFSANPTAQGIRALWRRANAWLGSQGKGVYAGKDLAFVDGLRLEQAEGKAKRIWYVKAPYEAVRRSLQPIPNAYRAGVFTREDYRRRLAWGESRLLARWKAVAAYSTPAAEIQLLERRGR